MLTCDTGIQACVMADITSELARRPIPRGSRRALRNLFLWLSLLLLFGLAWGSRAEAADIQQSGPVTLVGPGPQFAIADFDGDVRPDLASIQAGSNSSGTTDYRIQLHLTAAGRQSSIHAGRVLHYRVSRDCGEFLWIFGNLAFCEHEIRWASSVVNCSSSCSLRTVYDTLKVSLRRP